MAESTGFNFWDLLADPNAQQLLANIGAAADPEGAGGVIGNAASRLISSKASQSAAAKQLSTADAERQELRQLHRDLINRLGPVTPQGTPGLNAIKPTKTSNNVDLDIDADDPGQLVANLGGFTNPGTPGINSITRSPNGSMLVNYDLPRPASRPSISDEVNSLAAAPTANRSTSGLSYTPVSTTQTANEVQDLLDPYAPRRSL
jgi:hypothetical protein